MKRRIKIFLIATVITIPVGLLLGVFFSLGLDILYEDTERAFKHGMISGVASAIIIAVYAYVSGIVKKLILKYMNIKDEDIDEF